MFNYLISVYSISIAVLFGILLYLNYVAFKRSTGKKTTPILFFLSLIFSLVFLPLLIFILISFWIYRQVINVILILKHRDDYGGLLGGMDAAHTVNSASNSPVHFLFVIQYDQNDFYNFFKQTVLNKHKRLLKIPKIFASLQSFSGYSYLLKNRIKLEDCFKKLNFKEENVTKSELLKIIGDNSDKALPKNGLWDLLIGEKPVKWKADEKKTFYPVVLRFHHSLADGVSLLQGITRIFKHDFPNYNKCTKIPKIGKVYLLKKIQFYLNIINVMCLAPSAFLVQIWFKRKDANILYGPELCNKKLFALNIEEFPRFLEVVKRIKRNVPGCTFTDVFLTAITASLQDYFKTKSSIIPFFITAAIPTNPEANPSLQRSNHVKNERTICCGNNASLYVPTLPVNINNEDLCTRLKIIQQQGALFRNSNDHEINYWILRFFGSIFPKQIGQILGELNGCTMGVSNIPGTDCLSGFAGQPLQDVAFWLANRERTGVAFSILTYGGRLQMGLLVDRALVSNQNEVDELLDDVLKYVDLLDYQAINSIIEQTC